MLESVITALSPVATDAVGFAVLCREANLVWLRVPYVRELAARGGPCPRHQDLSKASDGTSFDASRLIVGTVPKGRMFSVSHGQ